MYHKIVLSFCFSKKAARYRVALPTASGPDPPCAAPIRPSDQRFRTAHRRIGKAGRRTQHHHTGENQPWPLLFIPRLPSPENPPDKAGIAVIRLRKSDSQVSAFCFPVFSAIGHTKNLIFRRGMFILKTAQPHTAPADAVRPAFRFSETSHTARPPFLPTARP